MIDGIYYNPTIVFFGKNMEARVGEETARYSKKIMLLYGGESFKKYGLYDKVTASLHASGVAAIELGGVKPNPGIDFVYKGIEICRKENIDFILAVGGGSVIDTAKAISIGAPYDGDVLDFFEGRKQIPDKNLKVAAILTLPGTGSESNITTVITLKQGIKKSYSAPTIAPVFSILNPELTYTLPEYYTECGIADAISHVMEMYFTNTSGVDCTDRICEGLIKTLMKYALEVKGSPSDYDIRAEIMWACKLTNDNTAGFGRKQDWSSHKIAHGLGALYEDIPHGAILSVLMPAWMAYTYKAKTERFVQFAERVFGIDEKAGPSEEVSLLAVNKFKDFLKAIGMPSDLKEAGITDKSCFPEISLDCVKDMKSGTTGNFVRLSQQDILNILNSAYAI
ncbi:MAG: hypothetical protein A2020_07270 [Lentisphaerae bacterium GWF2_45_14]|nr:MAG: hypothetical protein A2020_07270 [Lentisphaerae bacterium GWF2_45_14]